ncbi:pyridine nucleotide-disulfide oxidoreductase [Actinotalea ferrariae CF5-4]|uniref:Pyridine nucleotide-disulfide oxidoreductase n=1 Tax=Actinotalea ferrariae CF5-4 TaxID=948458 RepID=A0A021VQE1_9CELL|nr:FAD-dependent oxidoreductase [Actinotalea ferrariae]EYR63338.1 pyridine nucleotide-disulfide oxidoreductase [Actinotalea ferrariae CF5-4]
MSTAGLVVVGAGLAGVRAVEGARLGGFTGAVTLLGTETDAPYDRPPLSKAFLTESAALRYLRTAESLRGELDVDLRLGETATAVDPAARTVAVGAEELPYTGLVIATGSTARLLPGMHGPAGVHTLRSHADAVALRSALRPGSRVVVIGAGFIGSEFACSAMHLGAHVTVLEAADVPLVRAVGPAMGEALGGLHARHGIDVRCGAVVEAVVGKDTLEAVRLADGQVLPADLVLVGVGAAPVTEWLRGSGLTIEDGVVCDATLNAGAPGVYAAGDVARWHNPTFDRSMRLEHWTSAAEQGMVAGRNAVGTGEPVTCDVVPYFWSDWVTDRIQFVGVPDSDEVTTVAGSAETGDLLALYRTGDRVTGALGVNQRRAVLRLRLMIGQRADWREAVELARSTAVRST